MTAHTVYALCDETGYVVYVGCSKRFEDRVIEHRRSGREFAKAVALIDFDSRSDAMTHEKDLIEGLQPDMNELFSGMYEPERAQGLVHGTPSAYHTYGCRCDVCRKTENARAAANGERQRNANPGYLDDPAVHGTLSTYTRWRCRCEKCSQAQRDYRDARRAKAFAKYAPEGVAA